MPSCSPSPVCSSPCGSDTKTAEVKQAEAPKPKPKPADESRRLPTQNLTESKVVETAPLGHPFLPGGTLAHYKKGPSEYDIFVTRLASPTDAAILLLDYKKAMADPKLVPSFGGYFGKDNGKPAFVFPKADWLAVIIGLSEKDADAEARKLAARLD